MLKVFKHRLFIRVLTASLFIFLSISIAVSQTRTRHGNVERVTSQQAVISMVAPWSVQPGTEGTSFTSVVIANRERQMTVAKVTVQQVTSQGVTCSISNRSASMPVGLGFGVNFSAVGQENASATTNVDGQTATELLQSGLEAYDSQQYTDAKVFFDKILEIEPDDAFTKKMLDKTQAQLDVINAQNQLEERAQFWRVGARRFVMDKDYDNALEPIHSILEAFPEDAEAQAWLAEVIGYWRSQADINEQLDDIENAERYFQLILTELPDDVQAQQGLFRVQAPDENEIFLAADVMPEPIGGYTEISKNVQYPSFAIRNQVEGSVIVQFVVDENGDVIEANVLKGLGAGCDEEALRVVTEAKFTPGVHNGYKVKVRRAMPIFFRIRN